MTHPNVTGVASRRRWMSPSPPRSVERHDLNPYRRRFATVTSVRTLSDALRGADVFIGVSSPGIVDADMLHPMADRPLVFSLANPEPEIPFELVRQVRRDAIFASGRSDSPNHVNNVLAFPAVFRGALDVRSTTIDWAMKLAASRALAALARESAERDARRPVPHTESPPRRFQSPDRLDAYWAMGKSTWHTRR